MFALRFLIASPPIKVKRDNRKNNLGRQDKMKDKRQDTIYKKKRQDKTRQDRTRPGRTRQDKTRNDQDRDRDRDRDKDRARQDKTR